jgi:predicted Zn-dependent protease
LLIALRQDDRLYRLTGLAPVGSGLLDAMMRAAETFRPLAPAESAALAPARIEVATARPGDSVTSLARQMNVSEHGEERFRVLNGLAPDEAVEPGQTVKIVR